MNYNKSLLSFLLFLSVVKTCCADNRIVLQLRHAPEAIRNQVISEVKNDDPNTTETITKKITPDLSGFVALYGGYYTRSKEDGYISFPLRHQSKKLYLAITPKIELIKTKGDTVSHNKYSVENNNPTKLYLFEQKEDIKDDIQKKTATAEAPADATVDAKGTTKDIYWSMKEVPLPQGNMIDPITVVILSDPKNFVIDSTYQKSPATPQLVIPDLFVVGNENKTQALFEAMDISRYFENLQTEKKTNDLTLQKLINNP